MNNFHFSVLIAFIASLSLAQPGYSQDDIAAKPAFEVYRVHPYIPMTKEKLTESRTLSALNPHYKPSWVKSFVSVEIMTINKGRLKRAVAKNDILTVEQKSNMNTADPGTEISVRVRYIPKNNLTFNDIKEIHFSFTTDPEKKAEYADGKQQMMEFLKKNAIDKIPDYSFKKYQLAAVKFTIDEEGRVIDPHLFWTSENEKTDALLLETICNMPTWKPAAYANGIKVKQEFVLTVGDMESCVVPLLNIRQD